MILRPAKLLPYLKLDNRKYKYSIALKKQINR